MEAPDFFQVGGPSQFQRRTEPEMKDLAPFTEALWELLALSLSVGTNLFQSPQTQSRLGPSNLRLAGVETFYKKWDTPPTHWCRISSIHSISGFLFAH